MIETADDLADPNNAAAAYMKLQGDVKKLIVETVTSEIIRDPWGPLATTIRQLVASDARAIMDREIQNYRIVYRGTTANHY